MRLLFILLTVGASVSALNITNKPEETTIRFGCLFKKKVNTFSDPITDSVLFLDEAEFKDFYEKVVNIAKEEVGNVLIDSVDPFLTMYSDFKTTGGSFNNFYKSYDYPPPGEGGITTLLRIFDKINKLHKSVASSSVLGPINKNVDSKFMKKSIYNDALSRGTLPKKQFQFDGIVGIIRISVRDESGVVLIDLNYPKSPTQVVMATPTYRHLNTIRYEGDDGIDDKKTTFTYFTDYITYNLFKTNKPCKGSANDCGYEFESNDLLYTARSLNSIANTVEKKALLQPFKGFEKYTREGDIVAFVFLDVHSKDVYLYTDIKKGNYYAFRTFYVKNKPAIMIRWDLFYEHRLIDLEESYINDVSTRLGLDSDILKEKLAKLYEILNTGGSKIKKAFYK